MTELSDAELILEDIAAGVAIAVPLLAFGLLVVIPCIRIVLGIII